MPDNEKDDDFKVTLTVNGVNARSRYLLNELTRVRAWDNDRGEVLSRIIEDWAKDRLNHDPKAWEGWNQLADEYAERCREKAGMTSEKFDQSADPDHVGSSHEQQPEP
ncbi:MAG: hypothetical protein ACRBCK_05695 [Alphaproteobacteria bacterium]